MANNVYNNLQVQDITPEGQKVWDSFVERIEALPGNGHLTGLFYEADEDGYWIVPEDVHASEAVGAKWAFATELDDESMRIESAWSPVIPLVEHIAMEIGKVDPDVQLVLTYEDEMPNFIGVTTFTADGIDTDNDMDHDDIREMIFTQHPDIREMWDEDEGDWKEGKEDDGYDAYSEVQWEIMSDWQIENTEWSIR
jgi:hypothetical protein